MYFRFIAISAALVVAADASTFGEMSPDDSAADSVATRSVQEQLLIALESGDEVGLAALIQSGVDLNFRYPDERTLLMKALDLTPLSPLTSLEQRKQRRNEMAELLIRNGANPNIGANGSSPLLEALRWHKIDLARLLIVNRANPNFCDRFGGNSPLIEVARWSNHEAAVNIAELLIAHGANPNLECRHYYPLVEALNKKNIGVANLLIKRGADPNRIDPNWGSTPLIIVAGWTGAAESVEIANLLITHGADPNLGSISGHYTPLIVAITSGNSEMVEFLLNNNARVNEATWESTPLISAIKSGRIDMVQLLFDHGADVNLPSLNGSLTPIIAAVDTRAVRIAELLLERGAHPNQATQRGNTPLKQAIQNEDVEMVKALARHPSVEVEEAYAFAEETLKRVPATIRARIVTLEAILEALTPSDPVLK